MTLIEKEDEKLIATTNIKITNVKITEMSNDHIYNSKRHLSSDIQKKRNKKPHGHL